MYTNKDQENVAMLTCSCYEGPSHGYIYFHCHDGDFHGNVGATIWYPLWHRLKQAWRVITCKRVDFDMTVNFEDLVQLGEWGRTMKAKNVVERMKTKYPLTDPLREKTTC